MTDRVTKAKQAIRSMIEECEANFQRQKHAKGDFLNGELVGLRESLAILNMVEDGVMDDKEQSDGQP